MVDVGGVLSYATTSGVEALRILNQWLDSEEVALAWYGKEKEVFLRKQNWLLKLLSGKYKQPEIQNIFTIQKEDWQLVIEESLPVAHTWYRKRKDESGECSWLPLFWACRSPLGENRVLSKADKAFASLGIVSNLPAARLDLWGLVVMAYSNGARSRVALSKDGGFNATLLCKNFILNVSQTNVNAPTIGHLEPREHPAEDHEPLGVDESRSLLAHGHSFSTNDASIGWPLNGDIDPPPLELVDGQWDKTLKKMVLDYFQVCKLKVKFHNGIVKYWEEWASFMAKVRRGFDGRVSGNIPTGPAQVSDHPIRETERRADVNHARIRLDDIVIQEIESYHELRADIADLASHCDPSEEGLPKKMISMLENLRKLIYKQLWRLKLLLYDDIRLVDNLDRDDVLYFFREDAQLIKMLTHCHLAGNHVDHSREAISTKQELKSLMNSHQVVMARARMLNFCERIDLELSVRNTGHNVLLA
ncbi:hypothetical protein BJX96DRAFT_186723 [Aspergillus floccosus]